MATPRVTKTAANNLSDLAGVAELVATPDVSQPSTSKRKATDELVKGTGKRLRVVEMENVASTSSANRNVGRSQSSPRKMNGGSTSSPSKVSRGRGDSPRTVIPRFNIEDVEQNENQENEPPKAKKNVSAKKTLRQPNQFLLSMIQSLKSKLSLKR